MLKDSYEMVGVFTANVFDAEIIDDKAEGDGAGTVGEEARGVMALEVSVMCQVVDKSVIG